MSKQNFKRALSGLFAVACVAVLSDCSPESESSGQQNTRERSSLPVRAYEVSQRDLSRRIQLSSPVETLRTIALAARTQGIVRDVFVETGDRVEAGQLLAELDVREQRAELARAEAALREARPTSNGSSDCATAI